MKSILISFALTLVAITSYAQDGKQTPNGKPTIEKTYSCPMDKNISSNKPGKCSKCGMALREKNTSPKKIIR